MFGHVLLAVCTGNLVIVTVPRLLRILNDVTVTVTVTVTGTGTLLGRFLIPQLAAGPQVTQVTRPMEMRAVNEDANQSLVAGENSTSYGATDKGPVYKVCCDVNHQSPEPTLPNAVVAVEINSRNLS